MNAPTGPRALPAPLLTALWGVFCTCSWTWCIGMYLPIIMLDRYGWLGFWTFFIPNVAGCSAMGYVLRTRRASQTFVAAHRSAGVWFSIATVGYHLLFTGLVVAALAPGAIDRSTGTAMLLGLGWMTIIYGCGVALSAVRDRAWLTCAAATYAVSLIVLFVLLRVPAAVDAPASARPPVMVLWLAPVIAFGFLLCPYLDLTFHRAVQQSPSRHAFAVFGLTFAVMLGLTVVLWRRFDALPMVAAAHLLAQSVFTVGAHLREIRVHAAQAKVPQRAAPAVPWLAGGGALVLLALNEPTRILAENTYLRYLVLYGLVFPLYVWLFIGPGGVAPRRRVTGAIYAVLIILAAPFYEAGFIGGCEMLILAPIAVFMLWKLVQSLASVRGASHAPLLPHEPARGRGAVRADNDPLPTPRTRLSDEAPH